MSIDSPEADGGWEKLPEFTETDVLRNQIDSLDAAIQRLTLERTRLSQRVQQLRMASGGTKIQLKREGAVIGSYITALGPRGSLLAEAILEIGRGPLLKPSNPTDPLPRGNDA